MPSEEQVQQVSVFVFLLRGAGMPLMAWILGFGVVFSIWGFINVVRERSPGLIFAQSILSLTPAIFAAIAIYSAAGEFTTMATSADPPKPADIARVISYAMSCGFFGIITTVPAVLLGLVAFRKSAARLAEHANLGCESDLTRT